MDERLTAWEADLLLGEDAALWDYRSTLDQVSLPDLLRHFLSFEINALHEKVNLYVADISASELTTRMVQSEIVIQAADVGLVAAE